MCFPSLKDSYCGNGTSTFRPIKVRLSGDVEENRRPAITGVRGVSGPSHIANSGQHGASLPPFNRKNTNLLSVFYTNARRIASKRSFLNLELASNTYDIVLLTETHLDSTVTDREVFPQGCTVFRCDRELHGRHGGGILIAIGDSCKAYLRGGLCSNTSKLEFVEIVFPNRKKLTLQSWAKFLRKLRISRAFF